MSFTEIMGGIGSIVGFGIGLNYLWRLNEKNPNYIQLPDSFTEDQSSFEDYLCKFMKCNAKIMFVSGTLYTTIKVGGVVGEYSHIILPIAGALTICKNFNSLHEQVSDLQCQVEKLTQDVDSINSEEERKRYIALEKIAKLNNTTIEKLLKFEGIEDIIKFSMSQN